MNVTPEFFGANSQHGAYTRITIDWESDSSGNASVPLTLFGFLVKMITNPTGSPTDQYDITLVNNQGFDELEQAGEDRSGSNKEQIPTANGGVLGITAVCGNYVFTVANAGANKTGRAILIISH